MKENVNNLMLVIIGVLGFLCQYSVDAAVRVETREASIATGTETLGKADGTSVMQWDTTKEHDGWKTLNAGGTSADVLVLNEPLIVGGRMTANATWSNSRVVVVRDDVVVPSGKTLTLSAGCVVKFTDGARFVVESGGSIVANGAYLAAFTDDSVGGDTDMDGRQSEDNAPYQWWLDDAATAALAKVRFVDGSSNLPTRVYSVGKTYGTLPNLSLSGATFAGWYSDPDGKGAKIAASDVVSSGDTTLYANWQRSSISVESGVVTLGATDAGGSVAVFSGEAWNATCDADWVTVNVQDGVISYVLDRNASTVARAATIRVVTASGELRDITVTQNGVEQVSAPVIDPVDGTEFDGASRRVTISGAADDAEIRYTLDGSEPTSTSELYTKSFNVFDTTTVKARIFKSGIAASATSSARIIRLQTLAEALNVPLWTVRTAGAKQWIVSSEVSHDGSSSARSGSVGNDQSSTMTTTVVGAGTLTFWWRVDCEDDEDADNWDYLKFEVDGMEVARIDGDSGWKQISAKVKGEGVHTLAWTYVKDFTDDDGVLLEDCGWVDQVTWTAFAGDSEVPVAWLENLGVLSDGVSAAAVAYNDSDGDGLTTAEEYIAGTDPNDSDSVFHAVIEMEGGMPVVSCVPNLLSERKYTLYGRKSLLDEEWHEVSNGKENEYKLFRVGVQMLGGIEVGSVDNSVVFTVNEAGWKYQVLFDPNGGEGGGEKMLEYGLPVLAPTAERQGFGFLGWFTEKDGGEKVNASTPVVGEATYYAHWLPDDTIAIETDEVYEADSDGVFTLDLQDLAIAASVPKITVKGLPTGLKFDSKTGLISGKATKPGRYTVTVSATNATVKKPVTATFDIVVPNFTTPMFAEAGLVTDDEYEFWVGVTPEEDGHAGRVPLPNVAKTIVDDGWTLKVSGLPTGLKWDAKNNKITGVPTKAGTFTVTFTASKKGEANQVATITLTTEALPLWATGTFWGNVKCKIENGELEEESYGSATMTVAANGKVSGKISLMGTNWTFKADSFSRVERVERVGGSLASIETNFIVNAVVTAGKAKREMELRVTDGGHAGRVTLPNGVVTGTMGDDCDVRMWRNVWKDKATAAAAKAEIARWEGVYTVSVEDGGYLSLTVGKDGTVKAAGKLADGTAVSASAPLMYDENDGWFAYLYTAPSAYKGGAFAAAVGFDGHAGRVTLPWGPAWWASRNPQATGEYGAGFDRDVSFTGAYYDKLEKLNEYYEAVRVSFDGGGHAGRVTLPALEYTCKKTYLDGSGKKVTASFAEMAEAVDTLGQDGMTVSVNEKGAFVVAKATKPVQDKTTKEWSYDGMNDGALALSFAQATGIFKGSYTFWYDYVSAYDATKDKSTIAHTSKKVSFEGIRVQGLDEMRGFYLWDATGTYDDPKTGKPKTYKYKESHAVTLAQ